MTRFIFLSLMCVFFVGCASYGSKIDENVISKIEKGVTTEAQVYSMLGNPMSMGLSSDGKKFLMYMFTESQVKAATLIPVVGLFAGGADARSQMLQIWLDDNGVVTNFAYNTSNTELNTGLLNQ